MAPLSQSSQNLGAEFQENQTQIIWVNKHHELYNDEEATGWTLTYIVESTEAIENLSDVEKVNKIQQKSSFYIEKLNQGAGCINQDGVLRLVLNEVGQNF